MNKILLLITGIFLTTSLHAELDLSKLQGQQKDQFMKLLNSSECTCGCGMQLSQCMLDDPTCPVAPRLAQTALDKFLAGDSSYTPVVSEHNRSSDDATED